MPGFERSTRSAETVTHQDARPGPLSGDPEHALEFRVLECLARNAGMIVTQKRLIAEAWGAERQGDARGLRSYVKMIRQKIEPNPERPSLIQTEQGVGYRLKAPDAA